MIPHNRIKKVYGKNGRLFYYQGDGRWFGRTSAKKAEEGLANGKLVLWSVEGKTESGSNLTVIK